MLLQRPLSFNFYVFRKKSNSLQNHFVRLTLERNSKYEMFFYKVDRVYCFNRPMNMLLL